MATIPNAVLPLATCRGYFPSVDATQLPDPVLQDILDFVMADVTLVLGIDLSAGPNQPVSQKYQFENIPTERLRLIVPQKMVLDIREGPEGLLLYHDPSVPLQPGDKEPPIPVVSIYKHWIEKYRSWGVRYAFDRVGVNYTWFYPPTVVRYIPMDEVFMYVKSTMLNMVRMVLNRFDFAGDGQGAFYRLSRWRDGDQEKEFNAELSDTDYRKAYLDELEYLKVKLQGPRVG